MKAADLAELPIIGMPPDANAYHSIINWFEEAEVSPGLMHCCNSFSVVALLVRRGVGVSLLPPALFAGGPGARGFKIFLEKAEGPEGGSFAVFLPARKVSVLPGRAAQRPGGKLVLRPPANATQELRRGALSGAASSDDLERRGLLARFQAKACPALG